jgi:hypothetical protein
MDDREHNRRGMGGKRTLHQAALLGTLSAGMLVACLVALLAVAKEATFPGTPGKIAYAGYEGPDPEIYTINASGGGRFNVTDNTTDDHDPSWGSSK